MCHFGNGDQARQGPWMAMWVVQAHREKQIGCMGAAEFGLDSTEVQGWALCPVALGLSCCQGTSETGNVSRPSAHGTLTDLQNGRSRGRIPAECLEQKMLYAYATVCTQGGFTLSRK